MSWVNAVILTLSDLGKGLIKNPVTNLLDVNLSTKPTNILKFDIDNSLLVEAGASSGRTTMSSVQTIDFANNTSSNYTATVSVIGISDYPNLSFSEIAISDETELEPLTISGMITGGDNVKLYLSSSAPVKGIRKVNIIGSN